MGVSEHTELQARAIPEGPVQEGERGRWSQWAWWPEVGKEPEVQDFPAAGIEKMNPCITEVIETQGLHLITAFPNLLKFVCKSKHLQQTRCFIILK